MTLLVIAYPELKSDDYTRIQNYRRHNDGLYFKIAEPHFTIVFPVFDINDDIFIREIEKQSADSHVIDFEIKCATINKDSFIPYFHEFLVPDSGFSDIVKLHDKLYSGLLFPILRLDIDFIPHIGIGNSADPLISKKRVDELNSSDLSVKGRISGLDIVSYENEKIKTLKRISLNSHS